MYSLLSALYINLMNQSSPVYIVYCVDRLEYGYVCTGDAMVVLRMTPLASQVMALVEASRFEDAINLCMLCQHNLQLKEIDIPGLKYLSFTSSFSLLMYLSLNNFINLRLV